MSSQALADEDLMAVAEERLMQAEQRALRAEEATQVCLSNKIAVCGEQHASHDASASNSSLACCACRTLNMAVVVWTLCFAIEDFDDCRHRRD